MSCHHTVVYQQCVVVCRQPLVVCICCIGVYPKAVVVCPSHMVILQLFTAVHQQGSAVCQPAVVVPQTASTLSWEMSIVVFCCPVTTVDSPSFRFISLSS